jgi:hypothetical protein
LTNVRKWHIAKFFCNAKLGRDRGTAQMRLGPPFASSRERERTSVAASIGYQRRHDVSTGSEIGKRRFSTHTQSNWPGMRVIKRRLTLQLRLLKGSESMGNHDSKIVDACCVD